MSKDKKRRYSYAKPGQVPQLSKVVAKKHETKKRNPDGTIRGNLSLVEKLTQANLLPAVCVETRKFRMANPISSYVDLYMHLNSVFGDWFPTNKKLVRVINGTLIAQMEGSTDILIQLKDFPQIKKYITININATPTEFSAYIEGADSIRLDRKNVYFLQGTEEISDTVTYEINSSLASIVEIKDNKCVIKANNKNQLGEFILTASYAGKVYEKNIRVIPLW